MDRELLTYQVSGLSRPLVRRIISFYDDPENVKKFEEWKKAKDFEELIEDIELGLLRRKRKAILDSDDYEEIGSFEEIILRG